jgi:hypothetical protein
MLVSLKGLKLVERLGDFLWFSHNSVSDAKMLILPANIL